MMKAKNLQFFRGAVALAAVLTISGTAAAKRNPNMGGASADLSADRKTVTVNVVPQCHTAPVVPGSSLSVDYSIYIFQSHGRLINIGIGSAEALECSATTGAVQVEAIEGLTFQPGPATMIVKLTTYQTTTVTTVVNGVSTPTTTETAIGTSESGSKVNLH